MCGDTKPKKQYRCWKVVSLSLLVAINVSFLLLCPQHDILAGASPQSHNIVRHTAASVFLPTWYQRYWYSHRHFLFPMLPVSWLWNWPLPPWSVIKGERFARSESTYKGSYWSLHGFSTLQDIDYLVPHKQITLPAEIFFLPILSRI